MPGLCYNLNCFTGLNSMELRLYNKMKQKLRIYHNFGVCLVFISTNIIHSNKNRMHAQYYTLGILIYGQQNALLMCGFVRYKCNVRWIVDKPSVCWIEFPTIKSIEFWEFCRLYQSWIIIDLNVIIYWDLVFNKMCDDDETGQYVA